MPRRPPIRPRRSRSGSTRTAARPWSERLKSLRAAATASQQAHQQVHATAERRAALMAQMPRALGTEIREWRSRIGTLATAAADGKVAGLNLEGAMEIHEELGQRLGQLLGRVRAAAHA